MKTIAQYKTIFALLAAFVAALSLTAFQARAEEAESKVAIPATAEGIWKAIDQEMATLDQIITSNKLATVHQHAYAVRDLVTALGAHAEKLSQTDKDKLAADSKFVAALASRLDQSGDSGDQAGARSNYEKLKGVVTSVRQLGQGSSK